MKVMKYIGLSFFKSMDKYEEIEKEFHSKVEVYFLSKDGISKENPNGIPCLMYLSSKPCYDSHLDHIFYNYKKDHFPKAYPWITAFRYDRPNNSIYIKLHGDPDQLDLGSVQDREKGDFAHKKGFMAVVEDMSELELAHLIQSAL
jgi:hypothetical protein